MVAVLGNFNVMLASTARALWAMGRQRLVPPVLWISDRWESRPIVALVFLFLTTAGLMILPLDVLVVLDTAFNNISLMIESFTFLRLRYTRPDFPRPFKVFCGLPGAWYVTCSKVLVIGIGLGAAGLTAWIACASMNFLVAVCLIIVHRCGKKLTWRRMGMGCCDSSLLLPMKSLVQAALHVNDTYEPVEEVQPRLDEFEGDSSRDPGEGGEYGDEDGETLDSAVIEMSPRAGPMSESAPTGMWLKALACLCRALLCLIPVLLCLPSFGLPPATPTSTFYSCTSLQPLASLLCRRSVSHDFSPSSVNNRPACVLEHAAPG